MSIEAIRDELLAWLKAHRLECGDPHCAEPVNALAFLAHCIGMRSSKLDQLQRDMIVYEENCADCPHLRN